MFSFHYSKRVLPVLVVMALPLFTGAAAWSQTAAATYRFASTLTAAEVGAPALTAADPQGTSGFGTDTVFGRTSNVYNFVGGTAPAQQAGLTLDTASLLSPTNYSVEMVFKFTQRDSAWRRIIDVANRQDDSGFYVDPNNALDVYPVTGSANTFLTDTYYHVVLTVGAGTVSAYLDGVNSFTTNTDVMNINNANNPSSLMNFFLDNSAGGGQGEYSSGSISLLRVYNSALTGAQAATKYSEVVNGVVVPESSTAALLGLALPLVAVCTRIGAVVVVRRRTGRNKISSLKA